MAIYGESTWQIKSGATTISESINNYSITKNVEPLDTVIKNQYKKPTLIKKGNRWSWTISLYGAKYTTATFTTLHTNLLALDGSIVSFTPHIDEADNKYNCYIEVFYDDVNNEFEDDRIIVNLIRISEDNSSEIVLLPTDYESYYKFENNTNDETGNHNATPTSVTYTTGKVGTYAASFNGSSSYAQATSGVTNEYSVCCWVKTPDYSVTRSFLAIETSFRTGAPAMLASILSDSRFHVVNNTSVVLGGAVSVGTWFHFAYTRNNTEHKLFVNGVEIDSLASASQVGSANLNIGTGFYNYFNGDIDELYVFGRVLTDGEITAIYNAGV